MSRLALALLSALALAAAGIGASGADFTATSSSPTTITAAADFNTVTASMTAPAATLAGSVALSATAGSERGVASVTFQRAAAGTGNWVDICVDTTAAYDCSWNTAAVADGPYQLRATATDTAGYTRTTTPTPHIVDNQPLSVTLADPGAMSGTEMLTATAANIEGGLVELTIQHRAPGVTAWTTLCTGTTSPRSCGLNTTVLPEGMRELRAVARDGAGAQVSSNAISRMIDNTPPTTTPSIPSSGSGTVTMTADASDSGSGIAYVAFEALYAGVWYEFCRDASAPFSCSGDSAQVPDGTYSIRVVTVDNAGVRTTSAPSSLTIDNVAPAGVSITNSNAGGAGQLGAGDWVRLTWTEQIAPATVLAGWNGSSQAILVRVKDVGTNDEMDFYSTGGTRLNLVHTATDLKLGADFVTADAELNASMSQSGTAITVTLGTLVSGTLSTAGPGTMTWRPSGAATDLYGRAGSTAAVTESGGLDVDF